MSYYAVYMTDEVADFCIEGCVFLLKDAYFVEGCVLWIKEEVMFNLLLTNNPRRR